MGFILLFFREVIIIEVRMKKNFKSLRKCQMLGGNQNFEQPSKSLQFCFFFKSTHKLTLRHLSCLKQSERNASLILVD